MLWLCFVKKKKKPFYERCIEVFTNEMIHSLGFILEFSSKEIKKAISFTVVSKRIKYVGANLTNEVKDLYTENYKILLKEINEDLSK